MAFGIFIVPRRDYASLKSHSYKAPRRLIKKEKLKKEVIKRRFKTGLAIISITGLLASIFYWIFFSSLLLINEIEMGDEKGEVYVHMQIADLAWQKLQNKIWHFLPQNNYLLFKTDAFLKELEDSADLNLLVKKVAVQKIWPHKLLITFQKRTPKAKIVAVREEKIIIHNEDINEAKEEIVISKHSYLVDDEAVILGKDSLVELEPTIELAVSRDFNKGDKILEQGIISQILNSYNFFKDAGLPIAYFQLNSDNADSIKAYITGRNYYLYLSLDYSLQKQINNLLLTLERIGEAEAGKLQYIDLRIEERAYACCDLKIEE
ncbi:MAG: hypothetical protein ABH896_04230 [Candidatus Jacksonbacteria bacterium]